METLQLLIDYGKPAWEEDIEGASACLGQLREELEAGKQQLEQLVNTRTSKIQKNDKELLIATTDFFNYLRNNEKTLVQVKILEKRAKQMFEELKAAGKTNPDIEKQASLLLS